MKQWNIRQLEYNRDQRGHLKTTVKRKWCWIWGVGGQTNNAKNTDYIEHQQSNLK